MSFPKNTVLLIIDVQKGFDNSKLGERNNINAELNIKRLIDVWRATERPIIYVQHASNSVTSPFYPGKPGFAFKDEILPKENECVIQKTENSAFIKTDLESYLNTSLIKDIVIVGLTTDHCVSTTTRMGANLGFNMTIVSDATATFERTNHEGKHFSADAIHDAHLASLHDEFAKVMDTKNVVYQCILNESKDKFFNKTPFDDSVSYPGCGKQKKIRRFSI